MRSLTISCCPYTVIEWPTSSLKSRRWRRPSKASSMPRCARPSRSSRSARPSSRSDTTLGCSSTPARTRCSTYSRSCRSRTTLAMPRAASRWARTSPAGPAPMIATSVFMQRSAPACRRRQQVVQDGELLGRRRRDDADVVGDGEVPAGGIAHGVDRGARLQLGQDQLARDRVGAQHGEVGDDDLRTPAAKAPLLAAAWPAAETHRGDEVDPLDERAAAVAQKHDDLAARSGDLRGASGARKAHRRVVVVTDHGRVDVGDTGRSGRR